MTHPPEIISSIEKPRTRYRKAAFMVLTFCGIALVCFFLNLCSSASLPKKQFHQYPLVRQSDIPSPPTPHNPNNASPLCSIHDSGNYSSFGNRTNYSCFFIIYEANVAHYLTENIPNLYMMKKLGIDIQLASFDRDMYDRHLAPFFDFDFSSQPGLDCRTDDYQDYHCFSPVRTNCMINFRNSLVEGFDYVHNSCLNHLENNQKYDVIVISRDATRRMLGLAEFLVQLKEHGLKYKVLTSKFFMKNKICTIMKELNKAKYIVANYGAELIYPYLLKNKVLLVLRSFSRTLIDHFYQTLNYYMNDIYLYEYDATGVINPDRKDCFDDFIYKGNIKKLHMKNHNCLDFVLDPVLVERFISIIKKNITMLTPGIRYYVNDQVHCISGNINGQNTIVRSESL